MLVRPLRAVCSDLDGAGLAEDEEIRVVCVEEKWAGET